MDTVLIITVVVIFAAFLCLGGLSSVDVKKDVSLDDHRLYGQYRVLYNNGQLSQPFHYETAKFYAEYFGGKVVRR